MQMVWMENHDRDWRIVILALLLVAFLGPWTFDLIHVPSEYACSSPFIRLSDDFCGTPLSGIRLFGWVAGGFIYSSTGLVTGEMMLSEWLREFLYSLLLCLPLLPVFSTLLRILRRDYKPGQVFTIIAWIMAIGFGLFWGVNNFPRSFWAVWGIWLYIGLALSALVMEGKIYWMNKYRDKNRDVPGERYVMD